MSDGDPAAPLLLKMALVPLCPWPALLGFGEPRSVGVRQASNDRGPLERMAAFLEPPVRLREGAGGLARCTLCALPLRDAVPRAAAPWREAGGGMSRPVRQPGRRHGRQSLSFLCGSGIPKIKKRESEDSRVKAWTHLSACPLAGCGTRGDNPVLTLGEGSGRGTGTLQQVQMIGPRRSTG